MPFSPPKASSHSRTLKTDLHIHSIYSDGELAPMEILRRAVACGLEHVSITDHDNIHAYDEIDAQALPPILRLTPGVEIDARLVHLKLGILAIEILGYGIDVNNAPLREELESVLEQRRERGRAVMQRLNQRFKVTVWPEDLLKENATVMLPRVLRAYVNKGLIESLKEGKRIANESGGIPKVRKLTSDRVIDLIHGAGGKAVLAHPGRTDLADIDEARTALAALREQGLDGFEAHYMYDRKSIGGPAFDVSLLGEDWPDALRTGGSDAHIGSYIGKYSYEAEALI